MRARHQQLALFSAGGLLLGLLLAGLFLFLKTKWPPVTGETVQTIPRVSGVTPNPIALPVSGELTTAAANLAEADQFYAAGNFSAASEAYRAYLSQHPEEAAVWVKLGNAQRESGDEAGALRAYAEALTRDSLLGDAYLNSAAVHWQLGEREAARTLLREGIAQAASRKTDLETTLAVYEALPS